MEETLVTALEMENRQPSTLLSMYLSGSACEESDLEMNPQVVLTRPPDINLPPLTEQAPPPQSWNSEKCDILDVGLGSQIYESESFPSVPKVGKKCGKRIDNVWGAWFFFNFYFKPVLNEKSKAKNMLDSNGVSGFDKSDLELEVFMVQHDMENIYMWVFKEKPENALGKMQLQSYMNGFSRQGDRPFPFSVDKSFVRSHRMQRKHYRGLSNPQCVHGIEVVPSPNLMDVNEDDLRRWAELTGRDPKFTIPPEAIDYSSWRNQPANHSNGDLIDLSPIGSKRKKDFISSGNEDDCYVAVSAPSDQIFDIEIRSNKPRWLKEFSGVLGNVYGPVTAAKTIYEDKEGFLIVISLPFVDLQRIKVSWRNTLTHGLIKVSCTSLSGTPFLKRQNRTFKLTDPSPEHCPQGEFVREIPLSTRIPEDANIEAYYDGPQTILEILVPKLREGPEEHEVRVSLRPNPGTTILC
ncbi:uncharacterized protein LOC111410874 [Olea europaea var. sylvestris]|uniref:uncharacterized protein LOC111410874 n=1 Tax=Olea europaea var. sylvestris TaxID=158386 RepID=UPI000C1D0CD8|nr:uncharacterized protein LOC111410874 [Olea europaea var. sylvestris]